MSVENLFDRVFPTDRAAHVAVLFENRQITYEELRALVVLTAERLHAVHITNGDRVAILLNDSPEFIASFVAVISLGAIAVPINMALRKEEQLFILKDCGARSAIVEAQAAQRMFCGPESTSGLTGLEDLLLVSRDNKPIPPRIADFPVQDFVRAQRNALDAEFPTQVDAQAVAFILYTSGSTGEPKGAVHKQSDIFYTNETYCREVLRLREGDRLFSSSRLPFAYGLGNAFTFPLLNGFTTILCREKPSAEVIAQILREYRPTIFFGVPVVYRMLLDYHLQASRVPTSVGS